MTKMAKKKVPAGMQLFPRAYLARLSMYALMRLAMFETWLMCCMWLYFLLVLVRVRGIKHDRITKLTRMGFFNSC